METKGRYKSKKSLKILALDAWKEEKEEREQQKREEINRKRKTAHEWFVTLFTVDPDEVSDDLIVTCDGLEFRFNSNRFDKSFNVLLTCGACGKQYWSESAIEGLVTLGKVLDPDGNHDARSEHKTCYAFMSSYEDETTGDRLFDLIREICNDQ